MDRGADWLKESATFYLLPEVAMLGDAAEVARGRARAYAAAAGTEGFVPEAVMPMLMRAWSPTRQRRIVEQLTAGTDPIWEAQPGGWHICGWEIDQEQLVKLEKKKARDRDRKREEYNRAKETIGQPSPGGFSTEVSAENPTSLHPPEKEESKRTAASRGRARDAASPGAGNGEDEPDASGAGRPAELSDSLIVLQAKLNEHPEIAGVRWDRLTHAQARDIQAQLERLGDDAMVAAARRARTNHDGPPGLAQAWIQVWAAWPTPKPKLAVVRCCAAHPDQPAACPVCAQNRSASTLDAATVFAEARTKAATAATNRARRSS